MGAAHLGAKIQETHDLELRLFTDFHRPILKSKHTVTKDFVGHKDSDILITEIHKTEHQNAYNSEKDMKLPQ